MKDKIIILIQSKKLLMISKIARYLKTDISYVSKVIKQMEKDGLIEIIKSDGRTKLVKLK